MSVIRHLLRGLCRFLNLTHVILSRSGEIVSVLYDRYKGSMRSPYRSCRGFPLGKVKDSHWGRSRIPIGEGRGFPLGKVKDSHWVRSRIPTGEGQRFPLGKVEDSHWERSGIPNGYVIVLILIGI